MMATNVVFCGLTPKRARKRFPKEAIILKVGLDVGSTTIKCVVLDDKDQIVYSTYERHFSHILEKSEELLRRVAEPTSSPTLNPLASLQENDCDTGADSNHMIPH